MEVEYKYISQIIFFFNPFWYFFIFITNCIVYNIWLKSFQYTTINILFYYG